MKYVILTLYTEDGIYRCSMLCRLLMMDVSQWIHLNCALWSYEVYETMAGALMNAEQACRRGLSTECSFCHLRGATIGCFRPRCINNYHVTCARADGAVFFQDKVSSWYSNSSNQDNSDIAILIVIIILVITVYLFSKLKTLSLLVYTCVSKL